MLPEVRDRRQWLTEIEAGLFLADNGETLDLQRSVPTWRNFELVRVSGGPAAWQWAVLGSTADALTRGGTSPGWWFAQLAPKRLPSCKGRLGREQEEAVASHPARRSSI